MEKINIILNGNRKQIEPDMTINDILKELKYHTDSVAITLNETVVDKSDYNIRKLKNNDSIEILRYISGG